MKLAELNRCPRETLQKKLDHAPASINHERLELKSGEDKLVQEFSVVTNFLSFDFTPGEIPPVRPAD